MHPAAIISLQSSHPAELPRIPRRYASVAGIRINPRSAFREPMSIIPLAVLIAWIPIGAWLFRRFPVRIAILINFFAAWGLLPGAPYTPSDSEFPYWVMGVCLPGIDFLTKATAAGLAALAGILIFQRAEVERFRPRPCDLPMAIWCLVPILSAILHWKTFSDGVSGACYQAIAWGVPWLLGRIYFTTPESLLLFAKACVAAGLCYVPICLLEFFTGPQLYALLYGYEPYRWVGAARYVGYRPIGFLEDGNQLGIWMAASSLIAISLALRKLTPRVLRVPIGWAAAALTCTTLLCQSAGSIVLLLLLLPLTLLQKRSVLRAVVAVMVFGVIAFAALRMSSRVNLRYLAQHNSVLHHISDALGDAGRHSLVWRLARDEGHMAVALKTPILGSGEWNWWRNGDTRPWSLWLLIFGMYGIVGLGAFTCILFLPVMRASWSPPEGVGPRAAQLRLALAGLILMAAFDDLLNSAMILPYVLAMGGMASRSMSRRATAARPGKPGSGA